MGSWASFSTSGSLNFFICKVQESGYLKPVSEPESVRESRKYPRIMTYKSQRSHTRTRLEIIRCADGDKPLFSIWCSSECAPSGNPAATLGEAQGEAMSRCSSCQPQHSSGSKPAQPRNHTHEWGNRRMIPALVIQVTPAKVGYTAKDEWNRVALCYCIYFCVYLKIVHSKKFLKGFYDH